MKVIKSVYINLLVTEREGRTGEYWTEVVAVRNERSESVQKTTEGQYSLVRLELTRLVSSLLYDTRTMLVLSLPAFENKKYTAYDRFHGNGPYGEIPTKKEPIRTLGFTLPYNKNCYSKKDVRLLRLFFLRNLGFCLVCTNFRFAQLYGMNSFSCIRVLILITRFARADRLHRQSFFCNFGKACRTIDYFTRLSFRFLFVLLASLTHSVLGDFSFEHEYVIESENDFSILVCRLHIIKSHSMRYPLYLNPT